MPQKVFCGEDKYKAIKLNFEQQLSLNGLNFKVKHEHSIMKMFYLKAGQILGPIFSIFIVLVYVDFVNVSARSDHEVIGYGMLLPIFVIQITPLILGFLLTTGISSFMLYREKNSREKFLPTRAWMAVYKINSVMTILWLVIFGVPFLLFLITFLTLE
ncbi:hypothetical protein CWE08_11915 [Aliidiomarina iranensis]|uniref:Uncharacterized protein n=2 Tax=Aliidiomarina iranensis TaxID=1434071 RepID=A0A432VPL3_9GAMM|nr:hypothetical protein CWE08_11915 [Aliidiomarina iranensis]